jgi:hypothetical protein
MSLPLNAKRLEPGDAVRVRITRGKRIVADQVVRVVEEGVLPLPWPKGFDERLNPGMFAIEATLIGTGS